MFGHRRLFLIGLALFTAASLACGLAAGIGQLIIFRLVQGAGAALLVPQVLSLIQLTFDGAGRARAFSVYSTVLAGASVTGQILGGVLTSADIAGTGWRPVFLVNVPLGLALLAVASRLLPADRSGTAPRGLDMPGLLTLSPTVLLLVVPLVLGHEWGWPAWGWAMLAAGVVFFAVFVRTQRRSAAPLVPGAVLRAPGLVLAAASIFLMMAGWGGFLFTMALYLQNGLGLSPMQAGLAFVLPSLAFGMASLNWRRVPARFHRVLIPAGLVLSALGHVLVAVIAADGSAGVIYQLGAIMSGVGMGAAFSPALNAALAHVAPADAANASGLMSTITQLGQVVGVAALGAVFLSLAPLAASPTLAAAGTATNIAVAALVLMSAGCAAVRRPAVAASHSDG